MVEIDICPRFARGLTEIHPRSTSKFSLNLPKLPVGRRKLRSLHHHSASPRPVRDGRVFGVSSEAPFLLPLCCVRRQTTRTRLYGLRKAPPVQNGANCPCKGPLARTVGQSNRYNRKRWVCPLDPLLQPRSNELTRLERSIDTAQHNWEDCYGSVGLELGE